MRPTFLAIIAYFALAAVAMGQAWVHGPSTRSQVFGGDLALHQWMIGWAAFCVTHFHNPFVSQWINFPYGSNMLVNTSELAVGVVFAPVTVIFGPVTSLNVVFVCGIALSATSMFLVLRRWVDWIPACFAGGLVFGFTGYQAAESLGHLQLLFVPLVPVIFWIFIRALEGNPDSQEDTGDRNHLKGYQVRLGALLGLVLSIQFFISSEVVASCALVGAITIAALAVLRPRQLLSKKRLWGLGVTLGTAIGVAGALLAYPIFVLFRGPGSISGPAQKVTSLASYRSDLLSTVVPTRNQLLGPTGWKALGTSYLPGSESENSAYIGILLAAFCIFLVVRYRHELLVALGGVMSLIALVLGLGNRLMVDGKVHPSIPLPFSVVYHVPLLNSLISARFSLYMDFFVAIILAIGLEMLRSDFAISIGPRKAGAAAAIICLVALIPAVPAWPLRLRQVDIPRFFTSSLVARIPTGSPVVAYPYPYYPENFAMIYQAASDFRFKLAGGYVIVPDTKGNGYFAPTPSIIGTTLRTFFTEAHPPPPSSAIVLGARQELSKWGVKDVVLVPKGADPIGASRFLSKVAGSRPDNSGGVSLWRLGAGATESLGGIGAGNTASAVTARTG